MKRVVLFSFGSSDVQSVGVVARIFHGTLASPPRLLFPIM